MGAPSSTIWESNINHYDRPRVFQSWFDIIGRTNWIASVARSPEAIVRGINGPLSSSTRTSVKYLWHFIAKKGKMQINYYVFSYVGCPTVIAYVHVLCIASYDTVVYNSRNPALGVSRLWPPGCKQIHWNLFTDLKNKLTDQIYKSYKNILWKFHLPLLDWTKFP